MQRILLLLLLSYLLLTSCKKYEEDKFISLRSPYKRLKGMWTVEKYLINGADSTKNYLSAKIKDRLTFSYHIRKDGIYNSMGYITAPTQEGAYHSLGAGFWTFSERKNTLNFYADSSYFSPNKIYALSENASFNIIKLSDGEMILRTDYNNQQHEIWFEKKDRRYVTGKEK